MKIDKSEEERQELHKKILQVEQKEDEFMLDKMENLLYEHPQNVTALSQDLADTQFLNQQVKNYVDVQMDALGKLSHQTRNTLEEEREKLIKERNSLPCE